MGVDFSHCKAQWAYSGFMRFRERLAEQIGIPSLRGMEGFGGNGEWTDTMKADPIYLLLYHSDCDGELSPEECRKIAPRLREMVAAWPDGDFDKGRALELADGMEAAATANEPLEFR